MLLKKLHDDTRTVFKSITKWLGILEDGEDFRNRQEFTGSLESLRMEILLQDTNCSSSMMFVHMFFYSFNAFDCNGSFLSYIRHYGKLIEGLVSIVVRSWKGTKEGEFWTTVEAYHDLIEVFQSQ